MGTPGYLNSYDHSRINFFDGMGCNPDDWSLDPSYLDLCDNNLDYFRDEHTDFERMELYDIDELFMMEQLLFEQQVLRMRRINQLKQELYSEDDSTFLKKLMLKQQRLSLSLNNHEGTLDSRWMNQQVKRESFSNSQSQERNEDKDRWGEKFSVEQFSDKTSSMKSQTQSDSSKTSKPQEPLQKSRHCRHFLKGNCERGDSCGFRHDHSVFCTDLQKVFLGGLPAHLTSSLLRKKLTEQGYTVLNNPKILRWFSPQVCLGSVEEAQRLVEKRTIVIDNAVVQVRPFEAFSRDNKKKLPDEVERSVFLGGLSSDTTAEMIRDELRKMGWVLVNTPVLKCGYAPQVVLKTFDQAQTLIKLRKVQINGTLVSVRPYANIRSSSKKRKRTKLQANQTK
jgi:hypothetical protein